MIVLKINSVLRLIVIFCRVNAITVVVPEVGEIVGTELLTAWTKRTIYAFYSIRFALSPSGSRRFMPPEPVTQWENDYNATASKRECPQLLKPASLSSLYPGEDLEDCLFLNVFSPKLPNPPSETSLLPVMVYVHGGGFYEGSPRLFAPSYILEKDIVLVVLQYRLGPLGFLCLHTDAIAGNVGFMDQVMGLQWVHKHIKSFGGDNKRVTIFGHSAGAGSASLLLISPMVEKNLFQKVIIQSGSAFSTWILDHDPLGFAKALFHELTGSVTDMDVTKMESTFKTASLQEISMALIKHVSKNKVPKLGGAVIQKAGEVKFLDDHPMNLIKLKYRAVPMLTGVTRDDGSFIVTFIFNMMKQFNLLDDSEYIRNNLTSDVLKSLWITEESWTLCELLEKKYFKKIFESTKKISFKHIMQGLINVRVCGILMFKSPVLRHAKLNSKYMPSYFYTFDYEGKNTEFGYGDDTSKYPFDGGVHHSNELFYLFPYRNKGQLNTQDIEMAKIMVDLWTSFATDGVPRSLKTGQWLPLKKGNDGPYFHINSMLSYSDNHFVENEFMIDTSQQTSFTFQVTLLTYVCLTLIFFTVIVKNTYI